MEQLQNETLPETNVSNLKAEAPASSEPTPSAKKKSDRTEEATLMLVLKMLARLPADAATRVAGYVHHKHGQK